MGPVDNAQGFGLLEVQPDAKLKAVLEISRSLGRHARRRRVAAEDSGNSVHHFSACRSWLYSPADSRWKDDPPARCNIGMGTRTRQFG